MGGSGSGTRTQCTKIKEKFHFEHFSPGDLLRDEIKTESELGRTLEDIMKEGKLVPSEILLQILKKTIINKSNVQKKILLNGFPRSLEDLTQWGEIIGDSFDVCFLLFFECSAESSKQRILERAKTSLRNDENIDSFKKKTQTSENETKLIFEVFGKKGQIIRINSEESIEKVFLEVESLFAGLGFE